MTNGEPRFVPIHELDRDHFVTAYFATLEFSETLLSAIVARNTWRFDLHLQAEETQSRYRPIARSTHLPPLVLVRQPVSGFARGATPRAQAVDRRQLSLTTARSLAQLTH